MDGMQLAARQEPHLRQDKLFVQKLQQYLSRAEYLSSLDVCVHSDASPSAAVHSSDSSCSNSHQAYSPLRENAMRENAMLKLPAPPPCPGSRTASTTSSTNASPLQDAPSPEPPTATQHPAHTRSSHTPAPGGCVTTIRHMSDATDAAKRGKRAADGRLGESHGHDGPLSKVPLCVQDSHVVLHGVPPSFDKGYSPLHTAASIDGKPTPPPSLCSSERCPSSRLPRASTPPPIPAHTPTGK
ncbi:MAG: hypothetical protein WDW38_007237 [Sanguina aurantia]